MKKKAAKKTSELGHAIDHFKKREFDLAEPLFLSALEENPQGLETNFFYARLLSELNRFAEAEPRLVFCCNQSPANADYLASLALVLHKQGRSPAAQQLLEQAFNIDSNNALAHRNYGIMLLDMRHYAQCIDSFTASLKVDPNDEKTSNCLGLALLSQNRLSEALKHFKSAIKTQPNYENAYHNMISTLERSNLISEARKELDKANKKFPKSTIFKIIEATILQREGDIDSAITVLEENIDIPDPMARFKAEQQLGILYDRKGDSKTAFTHFKSFNKNTSELFNLTPQTKAIYMDDVKRCKKSFTKSWVKNWAKDAPKKPNPSTSFLIGFPRSGTTLLQQVLGSHSDVHATDEVSAIYQIIRDWKQEKGTYPDFLPELTSEEISLAREKYFKIHEQDQQWQKTPILVDKMPLLTLNVGVIHKLFPNSKIIFALRHPCDCILSCYMQFFEPNEAMIHFYDLDDIVSLYTNIMDIWQQYQDVFSLSAHHIRYEDVVSDFKTQTEELLEFLELPWQDQVLQYHKNVKGKSKVRTPSYSQVSEKIYDRARYRWERYRKHLEPYLDKLAPYAEKFGYDI